LNDTWTSIPIEEWRQRILTALIRDAHTLIELDRKIVEAIIQSNVENLSKLISEFRDTKIKVQKGLAQVGVVENVGDKEKEVLLRIQGKLPADAFIEQLESKAGEELSFYELSEEEVNELGLDLFYFWIGPNEYVRDIFKVNTLIFRTRIPESLRQYVMEARDCFALQQHNAVVSMCRTILEGAVKDLCEKKGFFEPQGENVIEINPKIFNQLLKEVSRGKLKRRAIKIYYRDACPVVHGDRSMNADDALRVLRETMDVVQELYSLHES
jgi:hypothetical protein